MIRLDFQHLLSEAVSAERAATYLGELAAWMIPPADRRRLALPEPFLPAGPGGAVVLFGTCELGNREACPPGLAPGFGLPFRWREDVPDSNFLPSSMLDLAAQVRDHTHTDRWGLGLDGPFDRYNIAGLPLRCDSAWAPLAAALLVAREGGQPQTTVFSTGRWEDERIGSVGCIPEKLDAVLALSPAGGGLRPTLWVPAGDFEQARKLARGRCVVEEFPSGTGPAQGNAAIAALSRLLLALDTPPARDAPLDDRLAWANREWVIGAHARRREYYKTHLVADLAARLRSGGPAFSPPVGRLALGLSTDEGLATLVIRALQPTSAGLIATRESAPKVEPLRAALTDLGLSPRTLATVAASDPTDSGRAADELAVWLRNAPPGTCSAVDITGGTKEMSAVLLTAARRAGARVLYLEHRVPYASNRPVYGEQRFIELDWVHDR